MSLVVVGNRTDSKSIWCYSDASTLAWSYDTGGHVYAVTQDAYNNIYAVGAAADNGDGNGTRNVWKLDSDGSYLDGANVGDIGGYDQKCIDVDSNYVYIGGARGAYRLTTAFGSQLQYITGYTNSIRVNIFGDAYIGTSGGIPKTLYKYNSNLVFQWDYDTNDACYSIDFDSNKDLIVGTSDGEVRKYLANGSSPPAGTWATVAFQAGINVRVDVASDDSIYAVSSNDSTGTQSRFSYLNSSGTEQWNIETDGGDLERVFIDSSDRVWVVGDDVDTYDTWLVDTTEHTFTDAIVLGADLKDVCGAGISLNYWRKILTEYMPNESPLFTDLTLNTPSNIYALSHDSFADFVSNEHINHTSITLMAGAGLTGGGDISANRTFAVDGLLEDLDTLGASVSDGEIIVATGAGTLAWESGATARTSLGVGTGDSLTFAGLTLESAATPQFDIVKTGSGTASFYNDGSAHFKGETTVTGGFITSGTAIALRHTADGSNIVLMQDSSFDIVSHNLSTTGLKLNSTLVTASAAELNILDGATGPATDWDAAVNYDYSDISGNDGNTDVTGAELEQLTDGSETSLHSHSTEASGADIVSNGSFTSNTTGWTTENCTIASVAGGISGNCLEITRVAGTNQVALQSTTFVPGATYRISFYVKIGTSGGGGGGVFRVGAGQAGVDWNPNGYLQGDAGVTWSLRSFTFVARATDNSLNVSKYNSTAGTMLFDEVKVIEVKKSLVHVYVGTQFTASSGIWTVMQLTTERADVLEEFNIGTYRFIPDEPGYYFVSAAASVEALGADKLAQITIRLNGDDYRLLANQFTSIAGTPVPFVSGLIYMDEASYLEAVVWHNHGSDRTINASVYASFLSIYKVIG